MAFGNYGYNPYVNPYAPPYQPQTQMPQYQPPQMQTPPAAQSGFVWVDGIEEARNFYVAPNNAVQLWDKNSPTIYKKSADSTGKPTMQIFDLVERVQPQTAHKAQEADLSDFVRKEELTRISDRLAAIEARMPSEGV